MSNRDQFSELEVTFCKLFKETIRVRIILKLLHNYELSINEFNLDDSRLKNYRKDKISIRAVNKNLTSLKQDGFIKYRQDGLKVFWSLNLDNELMYLLRNLFIDKQIKKKRRWSRNTDSEIKEYLFGYYTQYEEFKPAELKAKLNHDSYSISSARLSQVLRGFVDQGILKKEEKARYKIIDKQGYKNYN